MKTYLSIVIGGILLSFYSLAYAQTTPDVPRTLSYQGLLASPGGKAVDGLQQMTVRLYSDVDGHQIVWEDTFTTAIQGGIFNLMLGSQKPLPDASQMGIPLWIAVKIGNSDETKPTPLSASPYALSVANNSITAEKLATDYVGSISVNDTKITGKGSNLNFKAGPGLSLNYDPITNVIMLNTASAVNGNGKGANTQSSYNYIINETTQETGASFNIDGSGVIGTTLTVGGTSALQGAVTLGTASGSTAGKLVINDGTSSTSKTATITGASQYSDNRTYTLADVGANADFVMTQGNQSVSGTKTFSNAIIDSGTASLTTLHVSGQGTFGSKVSVADTLTLPTLVTTHAIVPDRDTVISLGDRHHKFRDLYLGPHSLVMGSGADMTQFSVGSGGLVITQSSTSSTDSMVISSTGNVSSTTLAASDSGYVGTSFVAGGPITSGDSIAAAGTITSGNSIIIHGNSTPRMIESDLTMNIFSTAGDILINPANKLGIGISYPNQPNYLLDVNGTFHAGNTTITGSTSIDAAPTTGGTITVGNATSTTSILGNVSFSSAPQLPLPQNNLYVGNSSGKATAYAPSTNSVLITDASNGGTPQWATTLPASLTIPSPSISSATINSAAITGGTISGAPISGSTGSFTTLSSSFAATLNTLAVTGATTMGGSLNMSGNPIQNVATPSTSSDAATKGYTDNLNANQTTALNSEISRAEAAENTLTTSLNGEISDRQAAVTAEASARSTADATLTTNLNNEISRAEAAEGTLTTDLNNEISNRQAAITSEASARSAADATLTSSISSEVTRAEGAENTLTTNLTNEVSNRQAAITSEVTARSAADVTLTTNLNNEVSRAEAAEDSLTAHLNNEISDRQSAITGEASARSAADNTLTTNLDAETSRAEAAEDSLTARLSTEISDRQAAITGEANIRSTAVATLTTGLSNETSRAETAEDTLTAHLNGEISDRQAADASEANTRSSADATLNTNLNAESTRAEAAEDSLTVHLNNETNRAESAENSKLPFAGGTMTGSIDMGGNSITNLVDPVSSSDAATKNYVDSSIASSTNNTFIDNQTSQQSANFNISGNGTIGGTLTSGTLAVNGTASISGTITATGASFTGAMNMNSHAINGVTDPSSAQDAATKHYVDNAVAASALPSGTIVGFTTAGSHSGYTYTQSSMVTYGGGNSWAGVQSMPSSRNGATAVALNGKIYVMGGNGGSSTVYMHDPITNTWTTRASMTHNRDQFSSAVFNGKIYVFGGEYYANTAEVYDPVANSWSSIASPANLHGITNSAAVLGDKIYLAGGFTGSILLNTLETYDPATNSWTSKATFSGGRNDCGLVAAAGKLYLIGGNQGGSPMTNVQRYDPASDSWTTVASLNNGRRYPIEAVINDKIYVEGDLSATAEVYDPALDTWTNRANMSTTRGSGAGVALDGYFYAIGGSGQASVERLNTAMTIYYYSKN